MEVFILVYTFAGWADYGDGRFDAEDAMLGVFNTEKEAMDYAVDICRRERFMYDMNCLEIVRRKIGEKCI